ncbi:putative toxin-antitoxin system toxin component, PIN family [Candidatus Curtissbacteria bacterium]|nr:putative toxin-antitoxin system toxin component, PIN family [Candidatus Curtissbacteria bacterium]
MTAGDKPTVVVDTNIFISAIIRRGIPYKLLEIWQKDKFTLITTQSLFDEIADVLKREKVYRKYRITKDEITKLLDGLQLNATFINPLKIPDLPIHPRDPKDDILLACCFGAKVDYLITGDEDLLVLKNKKELKSLGILTPKEFLSLW